MLLQIFKLHRTYLYKHPEARLHATNQTWRSFTSIQHHSRMKISLFLTPEESKKLNAEYPADNQPQNESVFFIWYTSISVPEPIYYWIFCESLFSLFIQHHKHQTLSTSTYPPVNSAPVTWTVFPCHKQVQQFIPVHDLVVKWNSNTKYIEVWWWCNVSVGGRQSLKSN